MDQKTHSGMKSYTCRYCKKSLSCSLHCKQHKQTHTGEKPFTCKHWEKSFSDPSSYRKHEWIHTGEKPFICNLSSKNLQLVLFIAGYLFTQMNSRNVESEKYNDSFNPMPNISNKIRNFENSIFLISWDFKALTWSITKLSFIWLKIVILFS